MKGSLGITPLSVGDRRAVPPRNWAWRPLTSCARLESGHTPSRYHPEWWGGQIPWISLTDIRELDGKVAQETREYTNEAGIANSSARVLPAGTVVLSRTASVGFVTIMGREMATSQDFVNWVCGPDLDPRFLAYVFRASRAYLRSLSSGAIHQTIYMPTVEAFEVCIPDLKKQKRIVCSLDEQIATVERARAAAEVQLEAAKALLAAYLREAFCGTEAQRWPCVPLGDAGEIVSGITLGRKLSDERVRPIAYLRVANVKDAYLDLSDVYTIEATDTEIERLRLRDGDLLLTEGGDPDKLGRGACWRGEIAECIHQNHIFRVRFDPKQVLSGFVSAQVASRYGKAYFLANANQTTGIATINQRVLAAFPLMVPSLEEQGRVVATLSDCAERAGRARKQAEEQMVAINALPAALLRRAFSGEL